MEETIKKYKNQTYGFDPKWAGKGAWRKISKKGKMYTLAAKELQERWGNPNEAGIFTPPILPTTPTPPKTNVEKVGGMIQSKTPKVERLKSFTGLLKDPSESVTSAINKSIKQRLRPEMIIKGLFGPMIGLMAAKAMKVSPERMMAVEKGFEDTYTQPKLKEKKGSDFVQSRKVDRSKEKIENTNEELLKELQLIRKKLYSENTIAVKFSKTSESNKQLEKVADYFEEKQKKEDVAEELEKTIAKPEKDTELGKPAKGGIAIPEMMTPASDQGNILTDLLGGALSSQSMKKVFTKIVSSLSLVLKKMVSKLPIIGPLVLGAFGLKDAYDEYMESGDFSSAVGAFFESVVDNLTFGLSKQFFGEDGVKDFTKKFIDDTKESFTKWKDELVTFLNENLVQPVINLPSRIIDTLSNTMANILESIGSISMDFKVPDTARWLADKFNQQLPEKYTFKPFENLLSLAAALRGKEKQKETTTPDIAGDMGGAASSAQIEPNKLNVKLSEQQQQESAKTQTEAYRYSGESRTKSAEELAAENKIIDDIIAQRQTPEQLQDLANRNNAFRAAKRAAAANLIPEQRTTANIIDQQGQMLQNNREVNQQPTIVAPVTNNNITNVNQSGGQQNAPTAPVRNEESSLMRMQNAMAGAVMP